MIIPAITQIIQAKIEKGNTFMNYPKVQAWINDNYTCEWGTTLPDAAFDIIMIMAGEQLGYGYDMSNRRFLIE